MFIEEQPGFVRLRSIVAERTSQLVLWIGSGLSIPAGLPTWSGLRDSLCNALLRKGELSETELERKKAKEAYLNASTQENYWLSFDIIKEHLGRIDFRSQVREIFRHSESCKIPDNYINLFNLPISGVLTLNIDRLSARTYSSIHAGKALIEFNGWQSKDFLHVLKGSKPFIANLHGTVEDASSWVLGDASLKSLLQDSGYIEIVKGCLVSKTVIFVGISPDDQAVERHIRALGQLDVGDNFWITSRCDGDTVEWADANQLQTIRYVDDGVHSDLTDILIKLCNYVSKDEAAEPVVMTTLKGENKLIDPDSLATERDLEIVRKKLNSHAKSIFRDGSRTEQDEYKLFEAFCIDFDQQIHRSWYITTRPPDNKFIGYIIQEEIAEGAFGRVFKAEDENGKIVAIKLLREEIRRKKEMLQSFRRGVRSMRILAKHNVEGMVPYEEASEIPAVVVMDYIEGPNLQEAVEAGFIDGWIKVLNVACQLSKIIQKAHSLPERVLHRDLRPANIMLKDFYKDFSVIKIVILDFDLSWHLGAQEESVVNQASVNGFLAPEQLFR